MITHLITGCSQCKLSLCLAILKDRPASAGRRPAASRHKTPRLVPTLRLEGCPVLRQNAPPHVDNYEEHDVCENFKFGNAHELYSDNVGEVVTPPPRGLLTKDAVYRIGVDCLGVVHFELFTCYFFKDDAIGLVPNLVQLKLHLSVLI